MPIKPALQISARGLALLKSFETGPDGKSFAKVPYLCAAKKWTIGWGHVIRPNEHFDGLLSEAGAEALLLKDVRPIEAYLNATTEPQLLQCEFDALSLLVFNIGLGEYDKSHGIRPAINRDDHAAVSDEWMRWVHILNGQRADGLVIRRTCELMLYQGFSDEAINIKRQALQLAARKGSL